MKLPNSEIRAHAALRMQRYQELRQKQALWFYEPVSESAKKVHLSTKKVVALFGGNGSSKSETMIVDMLIRMTGIIPISLRDEYPREKMRGPVQHRLVVESLTTTMHTIILRKMQWWQWTGLDSPGGKRGHWGWIPQTSLIGGSWEKSWSEKLRLLRLLCQ